MIRRSVKIGGILVLASVIPALVFLLAEGLIRLAGVDTERVRSDSLKIEVPLWAFDEANASLVQDVYRQILASDQTAASAEWLELFTEAPRVRYKMKPRVRAVVSNTVNVREIERGIKVRMESNSRGFRTRDWPAKKPPNTYRIVFMGDSTTFGWGVEAEERFTDLLAGRLNGAQNGLHVEAINLGIPGYTTDDALRLLEREAFRYHPDMLFVSFGANDSRTIPVAVKRSLRQHGWIDRLKDFMGRFRLYRLLRKMILTRHNSFDQTLNAGKAEEPREAFVTPEEYARNLETIIDRAAAKGVRTVLLGLCCPLDYVAKMSAVASRKGVPALDGMFLMLEAIPAVQQGLLEPETARYYEELYGREILSERRILYLTSDSCHPNRLGHRILAAALAERLFQGTLLPADPGRPQAASTDH